MILLNDFFVIVSLEQTTDSVDARISLPEHHSVYRGHFPDNPVVPGALMVQIILEIMEKATGENLRLAEADAIKFLAVIDPRKNGQVSVGIRFTRTAAGLQLTASLFAGPVIFFKLKAALTTA